MLILNHSFGMKKSALQTFLAKFGGENFITKIDAIRNSK